MLSGFLPVSRISGWMSLFEKIQLSLSRGHSFEFSRLTVVDFHRRLICQGCYWYRFLPLVLSIWMIARARVYSLFLQENVKWPVVRGVEIDNRVHTLSVALRNGMVERPGSR